MHGLEEKRPAAAVSSSSRLLLVNAVVLCVLVWGTGFLFDSVAHFKLNLQVYKDTASHAEPKAPFDVADDGRVALNFSHVRDGLFRPQYKEIQWIREPNSLSDDKGTYLIKEAVALSDDTTDYEYTVKSIVDDDYQYTLYNSSSFCYDGLEYEIDQLTASPDLKLALLRTNSTKNWRYSTFALYWVLDIKTNGIEPLYNTQDKLFTATWALDSTKIAFVYDNNVYYRHVDDSEAVQITFDGTAEIFNGRPDWVYEEEVFQSSKTLVWSPDSKRISYLRFNDTEVPKFPIPLFVQRDEQAYPDLMELKYPKPGYPNPVVDQFVFDLESGVSTEIKFDSDIDDKLLTDVVWISGHKLLTRLSTRASDCLEYHLHNTQKNTTSIVRRYSAQDQWFEVTFNTLTVPKNEAAGFYDDGYIDKVMVDGYDHLAYFAHPEDSEGILLTTGRWEVLSNTISLDYATSELYFSSTKKSSVERHIYSLNLAHAVANSSVVADVRNVTDVSTDGYYSASFSSGSRYAVLTYSGPDVPYQQLVDLQKLEVLSELEANAKVQENLEKYVIPQTRVFTITLHDENQKAHYANAQETLPLDFNPRKKYPVIFFVYGGPGSQTVKKTFDVGFSSVLAAELNAVVVTVDGRGTGYNNQNEMGAKFKFIVRDRLGHYEVLDQILAAKTWRAKAYVDPDRIAIWGWSYGGFMTLKTLEADVGDTKVFSYGVSVAPVTNWRFYDTVYTERYMRKPQDNEDGYKESAIHLSDNYKQSKRFLVMHGSGDDNVHLQNTLKFIDDLNLHTAENFDFMIFPDADHSISYHNGNTVVFDRILTWFRSQLAM